MLVIDLVKKDQPLQVGHRKYAKAVDTWVVRYYVVTPGKKILHVEVESALIGIFSVPEYPTYEELALGAVLFPVDGRLLEEEVLKVDKRS